MSEECVLLVDDNRAVTDALSTLLEQTPRKTIVCSDIESAEMMLARVPVTHVVTDVQFSGEFGYEGLHFVGRLRAKAPQCRIVMISGRPSDSLRAAALNDGADAVLWKPFTFSELESALGVNAQDRQDCLSSTIRVPSIEEILKEDLLSIAFQPIVRIDDDSSTPFAFEALARVCGDWPADTTALFEYAERRGHRRNLNLLAISHAIEASVELPATSSIFINVDPLSFGDDLLHLLERSSARAGLALDRLVVEITERSAFADPETIAPLFAAMRAKGIRFALDDHGSAYSHLAIIDLVRPSFIKISNTFGTGLEDDETHRRIVANVTSLARELGCETILEGIECAATARAAVALGVDLVQGYHYGRPSTATSWAA